MKKVLFALVLLGLAGGAFYIISAKNDKTVEAVRPQRGPAVQAVYATGTVEPTVMMPIAPRSTARLLTIEADEGQDVIKGQVLGQLESSETQSALEELQARQDFAQKDYTRKAELLKRDAVSKNTVDQAKADLDAAKAAANRVKAELGYLQLVAPEAGIVIRRDGEVGELIPANQPVFWMSCCAPLRISAEVDEEDIALVKNGMAVVIRADAFPGKTFKGKVNSITPKGDAISRSYRVRIGLDGDTPLLIGMTAETNIIISETKDALLIPAEAVKSGAAWVIKDGKLSKRDVETGAKTDAAIEIKSGITTDDVVVSNNQPDYEDGQGIQVKIRNWKAR